MDFRILGTLEVADGDQPVKLAGPKLHALLALLLLRRNETISPDRLISELWVEHPPDTARNTLQVYVSQLRRTLGSERVVTEAGGYRLLVAPAELDLERFERLVEQGRQLLAAGRPERAALLLRESLSLWRGPALADLLYEPFADREAERFEELRLAALELRIEAELALGRHPELCAELRLLVDEHPLRERLRAQLMLALYRSGRQADALEVYSEGRSTLEDQLGLEPGEELRTLQRQILNHDPTLAPPAAARAHLPVWPGRLVGRERELAVLGELLQEEARWVTITGPPGVGKTRLALEVARELAAEHQDGVFFVELAPLRDPFQVPGAIAQALELDLRGGKHPHEQLAAHLRQRELLIVLDNCEHLPQLGSSLSKLLAAAPGLKLLLTSREPLRLAAERRYQLSPLLEAEAIVLFAERAQQARPDFLLTEENNKLVAAICARLDGLPLALELAAARIRLFSPKALLAGLTQRLPLLSGGDRDLPARQRTLRSTIAWSYGLLDEDEQRLLRSLSVFVGGFDAEAAGAICDASQRRLEALVEKNLLTRDAGSGDQPRYRLLETVREFAGELLEEAGERNDLLRRHAAFFLALAEKAEPFLQGSDRAWTAKLAWQQADVRAALRTSLDSGESEAAARLASALWRFWISQSQLSEGRAWLGEVLSRREALSKQVLARTLEAAAPIAMRQGDFDQAGRLLEEGLVLSRDLDDVHGIARLTDLRATLASMSGDLVHAINLHEEGLRLLRPLGDATRLADAVNNFAVTLLAAGEHQRARAFFEESLKLYTDVENRLGIAINVVNLGHLTLEEGDIEDAVELYQRGMRLSLDLGCSDLVAESLEGLAAAAVETGSWEAAARNAGSADSLREQLYAPLPPSQRQGYERRLARARNGLGDAEFDAAWNEGRTRTQEEAVAAALEAER